MRPSPEERYAGCLLGLACGDAVGTAAEFMARDSFAPIATMRGGGPFALPPGCWTDDTSMALCLATSLLERSAFDAADQMTRYLRWFREGYLSSTGRCFDIGNTVHAALLRFAASGEPYAGSADPASAGNGSLMRLAPVVLYFHGDRAAVVDHAIESSRTTHAAPEALECCALLARLIDSALAGGDPLAADPALYREPRVRALAAGGYRGKRRDEVRGTGYCVAALEAALWCVATTASFEAAVLAAANLGDDADTTAAITGQLAGAHYGVGAIPRDWLDTLHGAADIAATARALYAARERR